MYVCIYMSTDILRYTDGYKKVCIYIYIHTHINIHCVYTYIYAYVCIHSYTHIRPRVCVRVLVSSLLDGCSVLEKKKLRSCT